MHAFLNFIKKTKTKKRICSEITVNIWGNPCSHLSKSRVWVKFSKDSNAVGLTSILDGEHFVQLKLYSSEWVCCLSTLQVSVAEWLAHLTAV